MITKMADRPSKRDSQSGYAEVGVAAFMIIATLIPVGVLIAFAN